LNQTQNYWQQQIERKENERIQLKCILPMRSQPIIEIKQKIDQSQQNQLKSDLEIYIENAKQKSGEENVEFILGKIGILCLSTYSSNLGAFKEGLKNVFSVPLKSKVSKTQRTSQTTNSTSISSAKTASNPKKQEFFLIDNIPCPNQI